jgi:outer membrane protein OmpA-like peptidoglycan-associated protein
MKLGISLLATAALLAAGCSPPEGPRGDAAAVPGAAAETADASKAVSPEPSPGVDPDLDLARELMAHEKEMLFGGGDSGETDPALLEDLRADIAGLDFGDDPEGRETAHSLFGENPLLSERNPLLTHREREQWLASAIKNVGRETALAHLREEARKLAEGSIDRAGWYEHVAACEKVCNRIVSGLLHSHVQRVRELPHRLVVFGSDEARPSPESLGALDGWVEELAAASGESPRGVLLIGRASRSGAREYNRRLSERRVAAVRARLVERGWSDAQIHGFGLGYEPPQITREIARLYGLDLGLSEEARNQSVLVVAYPLAARQRAVSPPGSPAR